MLTDSEDGSSLLLDIAVFRYQLILNVKLLQTIVLFLVSISFLSVVPM